MEVPRAEIGMALGSPAHPPSAWQQNMISPSPYLSESTIDDWNSSRAVKQKSKGWKMFGGLFGGKKSTSAEAFYQFQPEGSVRTMIDVDGKFIDNRSDARPVKSRGRGRSVSGRKIKKDSKPAPSLDFNFKDSDGRATLTPAITLDGNVLADESQYMRKRGKSLLDVDIPDIRMERYSIMFGSVLGDSSISSQSLLVRRQATLDKLKTDHNASPIKEEESDATGKYRVRSATSLQIRSSQSPAFSLFTTTTPSKQDHLPINFSSLQRSNTSPAALSPSQPSFASGLENGGHTILISAGSGTNHSNSPVALQISSLMRTDVRPTTLDEGCVTFTTSQPITEEVYDLASFSMMDKSAKPQLQSTNSQHVRAPEASTAGSTPSSSVSEISSSTTASSLSTPQSAGATISRPLNISSPTLSSRSRENRQKGQVGVTPVPRSRSVTRINNASAGGSRATSLSKNHGEEDDSEECQDSPHMITANISIARSISVSRQQRQLLVPMKTSSLRKIPQSQKKPGLGSTTIIVAHVASPLGAMASAAQAERERTASPLAENRDRFPTPIRKQSYNQNLQFTERLVESTAKSSTPTLVIVGDAAVDAREQRWAAATANLKGSIADRRKIRKELSPVTGAMQGRLKTASAVRGTAGDVPGHAHRKSENAVVEQIV